MKKIFSSKKAVGCWLLAIGFLSTLQGEVGGGLLFAQTTITMTTNKERGDSLTFRVNGGITLSVNVGGLSSEVIESTDDPVTVELKGSTVKIEATGLTDLDVSGQQLKTLTFASPDELECLICSNNELTQLPLAKATALKTLWCDGNQLVALGIKTCTELESVICDDNLIYRITRPDNGFENLIDFWAADNKFETIDLSGSKTIKTLNMENNLLTAMTLSPLSEKALAVFLDGNNLDFRSFWKNTNVTNYLIGDQGFLPLAKTEFAVKEDIETPDLWDALNADSVKVSPTYTWYQFDSEGNATKLTRGSNDYNYKSLKQKNVFVFYNPFEDVQLQITSAQNKGVTLVSDHLKIYDPTGIETAEQQVAGDREQVAGVYDLSGQLINGKPATKGVYIVNGQKVFVR